LNGQEQLYPTPVILGFGTGFTVTRIEERPLWGLNARLQSYLGRAFVYRGYASFEFAHSGDTSMPRIASVGGEIGLTTDGQTPDELRPRQAFLAFSLAIGASICHFTGTGYNSGFMLAGTGSTGLEVRLSQKLSVFGDLRVYIPSRLGSAGYASDPYAAFPGVAFGIMFTT
jgi:hypothetical protein